MVSAERWHQCYWPDGLFSRAIGSGK